MFYSALHNHSTKDKQ